MEGIWFFETSATADKPTRRNIQEDFNRKQHRSERRRSRVMYPASPFNIGMGEKIDINITKMAPVNYLKLSKKRQKY